MSSLATFNFYRKEELTPPFAMSLIGIQSGPLPGPAVGDTISIMKKEYRILNKERYPLNCESLQR